MTGQHVLEFVNEANHQKGLKEIFKIAFEHTLDVLRKEGDYHISLTLVSKEEIHRLNKEYRDIDRPTDVLTFAFQEADVLPDEPYVDLGNIIISPEIAVEQAKSYQHPYRRELAFLFIHGLLHSFGYDHHRSEEEAEEMFALQNRILNSLPFDFYTDIKKAKALVKEAQSHSRAPYSNFHVGALVMTKDGKYHRGFNIENATYPLCMCAERVALYHTFALGYTKKDIASLTIIADSQEPGSPCGSCRQVMSELMDMNCFVYLYNKDQSKMKTTTVSDLLPYAFTSEDMKQ